MASPSWDATQPPTPMMTSRSPVLNSFQRPSWLKTFSCAFSRIEQVLTRMTSASSGRSVSSSPSAWASTSAILAESYSFIWQPWVLMYSLPRTCAGRVATKGRGMSEVSPEVGRVTSGVPVMALNPVGWAGKPASLAA